MSTHPFTENPHRTLLALSLPVLISLVAEPVTGLVDTAYIARLGTTPLAALGVGTAALSSVFWVFGFLGVGTQTEIAQVFGRSKKHVDAQSATIAKNPQASQTFTLALLLGLLFSVILMLLLATSAASLAKLLGATGEVQTSAVRYVHIRLFGAPAVLITLVAFGALRGVQDMRTPLYIAALVNILNILLDYPFIFGWGTFPALGITGAALASVISQWIGAALVLWRVWRIFGFSRNVNWRGAVALLMVGADLLIRTSMLMIFVLLTTRIATQAGAEEGAAHQAIRQFFLFSALFLDAFAVTTQSLVGYFIGASDLAEARRVVRLGLGWAVGTGCALAVAMLVGENFIAKLLVPEEAWAIFRPAWRVAALSQPINAATFLTDGAHWGTSDYRYLRNGMILATAISGVALLLFTGAGNTLTTIWMIALIWVGIRCLWGIVRIWPGSKQSPFIKMRLTN